MEVNSREDKYIRGDGLRIRNTLLRIRIQLFIFNSDPDPAIKVIGIYDHWSVDLPGSILSLQASIMSVHRPP